MDQETREARRLTNFALFLLFLISGFCALLYQTIWLRLAFAAFGIVTPVISVIVSVFMLGLSLGAWAGGRYASNLSKRSKLSPLLLYAVAELITGISAIAVPLAFERSSDVLLQTGSMNSASYMSSSALLITMSILPWCVCMGATVPLAMAFVKRLRPAEENSFSFLYLANLVGSAAGALLTAVVLIELLGFHQCLLLAACGNGLIALVSSVVALKVKLPAQTDEPEDSTVSADPPSTIRTPTWQLYAILFATGFSSMGMEVAWVRAFLPVLGHAVYAFATLLFVYLWSTALGAYTYRVDLKYGRVHAIAFTLPALAITALFPVVLGDPRLHELLPGSTQNATKGLISLLSIAPFCFILGYLTPQIIDTYSRGKAKQGGFAYSLNILGCIIGPLIAGYVLLPALGARISLVALAIPLIVLGMMIRQPNRHDADTKSEHSRTVDSVALPLIRIVSVVLLAVSLMATSYDEGFGKGPCVVRRDYVATVLQSGKGIDKNLFVNGVQMTALAPVTKEIGHLPLLLHNGPVENGLGICFGMGTSFRSQMTYGVDTTWVELVPSVVAAFDYYHQDADELARNPKGRIVIDDGRRYLRRTSEKFDLITVDAPPPPEASGVSLLFSDEFYKLVKEHLRPNGIVETLIPQGSPERVSAQMRSFTEAFRNVCIFHSRDVGYVCLGSQDPLPMPSVDQMIARMPERARDDLVEWRSEKGRDEALRAYLSEILASQVDHRKLLVNQERITDDHPYNEYFLMREFLHGTPSKK